MYNWIWILNDIMAGLNSHIISPNQNLVNNHMKVLIIIKLDNDNYQQCGFPIGWIHALQSSVFVLIKYTKRYFLLRSVQEREYYSRITHCNSLSNVYTSHGHGCYRKPNTDWIQYLSTNKCIICAAFQGPLLPHNNLSASKRAILVCSKATLRLLFPQNIKNLIHE